jgi:hypothetical protein
MCEERIDLFDLSFSLSLLRLVLCYAVYMPLNARKGGTGAMKS